MIQIFRSIEELLTLDGVVKKDGRRILEKDLGRIPQAAFVEREGRLVWVGRESELTPSLIKGLGGNQGEEIREHEMDQKTVMPSFTEAHTHLIFAGGREKEFEMRCQGVSYEEVAQRGGGILSTVRKTREAAESTLYALAQPRVDRFIDQGVTCLEIKSGYALNDSGEIKMLQVAGSLLGIEVHRTFLGPHACAPEYENTRDFMDHVIHKMLPQIASLQLATRADIFIDRGYFDTQMALDYFTRAQKLGFQLTAHVEQLHRTGGGVLAAQQGALSVDHLVQSSDADMASLSTSHTVCLFLPVADLYLQMPYPKARSFIEAGACVALATDFNPGSCPTQSLSTVGLLARLEMGMSLAECLSAYTYGASKALGVHGERGSLTQGKLCDFICLDGSWRELFYSIDHHPVSQVWHRGRRLR